MQSEFRNSQSGRIGQLDLDLLGGIHPFRIQFDETGQVHFASPSAETHLIRTGESVHDRLVIESSKFTNLIEAGQRPDIAIVLTSKKSGLRVRATVIRQSLEETAPESELKYVLIATPLLKSADEVIEYGLNINDFSVLDTVFDHLMLLQHQKSVIADLKSAQAQLDLERSRSLLSSKLAAIGEMSAGIAHEINNPLAVISGTVSLIPKYYGDPEKLSQKLEAISKACRRIEKIVKGLKRFSRTSVGNPHRVESLLNIFNEVQLITEIKAKRFEVPVTLEIEEGLEILCDAVEIEQVFINLLNNSIDAVKTLPEKWIRVRAFRQAGQDEMIVQVKDSGSGISKEIEEKIFQPFFTTKPVGEGTGLGLSIVRGILEQHKATIQVNKDLPNTCFEIRFKAPVK